MRLKDVITAIQESMPPGVKVLSIKEKRATTLYDLDPTKNIAKPNNRAITLNITLSIDKRGTGGDSTGVK